jgi:hypothetical protein
MQEEKVKVTTSDLGGVESRTNWNNIEIYKMLTKKAEKEISKFERTLVVNVGDGLTYSTLKNEEDL